ncbi:hypothetical protein HAZT_HAZT001985 [Hyalella azteca]|uniref:Exonuclease domain-containing protein n=1 Tax=Hyalella azteca TaxID=294128 RepID=A0A6A0H7R5_HYAAZ|nr:hypothetical protein HAZT_HAZT001985 [Hyalella azteca]
MAAQLAIPPSDRTPLLLSDLRTQFHWASLEGHYDPYKHFDCRPDPFNLPTHCLNSCIRALLPRCQINFQIKLEMVAPSKYKKTVLQELFLIRCPSSVSAAIKSVPSNDVCSDGSYSRPPVISTKDQYARVTPDSPMFGLDCEFVYVRREDGEVVNALGSICLVNEYGAEVYHTLVKPTDPIVNYCTAWSGLTEEKLSSVITTLADVQEKIRKHLPPDAILVGHSIDNDLKVMHVSLNEVVSQPNLCTVLIRDHYGVALRNVFNLASIEERLYFLQMFHPYIIDTSIVYNLSGNHKPAKLKTLAKQFLDKEIQSSTRLGHDASEDAAASLELVQLKLQRDIKFGDASFGWCEEILPEHNFFYNMFEYLHELRGRDFGYKNGSSIITTSSLEKKVRRAMKGTPECYNFKVYDSNQEIFDAVNENKSLLPNRSVIHLQTDPRLSSTKVRDRIAVFDDLDRLIHLIWEAVGGKAFVAVIFGGSMNNSEEALSNGIYMASTKRFFYG